MTAQNPTRHPQPRPLRFLVDECTGPAVARWLESQGHDTFSVYDDAPGIDDDEILTRAVNEGRILVTNDKDFGEMIFRQRREHCGVVFLRLENERATSKVEALRRLLEGFRDRLPGRFVVVTPGAVRFADSP